ncbi:MAG TPA: magnesium transporter [Chthoniobacterales bacterium]|jgi:magnesium transporter|nr:magnesium transporter [Chthoniobacterales bacterium]
MKPTSIPEIGSSENQDLTPEIRELFRKLSERAPREGARLLSDYPETFVVDMLELLNPAMAIDVLECMPDERQQAVMAAAPPETSRQWMRNESYPEHTIGRLMQPPLAVFRPDTTIGDAIEQIRTLTRHTIITYGFVTDDSEKLLGVIVMRDMMLGRREQQVQEVMLTNPFYLEPEMTLTEAMNAVLARHYPVYPVCDIRGELIGLLRGQMLFEAQAVELSAQPGSMVGVEKQERLTTPWSRSLRFRHPWLQVNLISGFIAAAVVGYFQDTIDRILVLAVFVPVLIGQSSNTGVQTLSVALRGMTLGELHSGRARLLVAKETWLGFLNGVFTGLTAALGMLLFAKFQGNPQAGVLAWVVFLAVTGSCLLSGIAGALVPLIMRKFGADPVTASSIVLTTITDVASLAVFLGLATWIV